MAETAVNNGRRAISLGGRLGLNNINNNSNFNANDRNINNNNRLRGIAQKNAETISPMTAYRNLWKELYSYENLVEAFKKARKHKTLKPYVQEFEKNLK